MFKQCPATSLERLAQTHHACVDILKMDVEGAELAALGFGSSPRPPWCAGMLLLEFHPDKLPSRFPPTLGTLMSFVHWLEAGNVSLYHSEIVSPMPKFFGRMELAFVNTSWLSAVAAHAHTPHHAHHAHATS